jgi:hypothetical protein
VKRQYLKNLFKTSVALALREDFWYQKFKPSYNVQTILQPRASAHYRFGKSVSQEIRDKPGEAQKKSL